MLRIMFKSSSYEISLRWMPQNTFDVNISSGDGFVASELTSANST